MQQLKEKNLGQVKNIDIPGGWEKLPASQDMMAEPYLKEYSPVDNSEVKLIFYYRGKRVDKQSGVDFMEVLKQKPHALTPQEKAKMVFIIRDAGVSEWFETLSMRTDELNHKMVLMLEGIWHKTNLHNLAIFVDTDHTGTAVQEIHYTAPPAVYLKYLPAVQKAIKSIKWK